MKRRVAAFCAALLSTAVLCGSYPPGSDLAGEYRESGVTVTLLLRAGTLTATYRPDSAGFHLYSADLPVNGMDGLGRPTVLTAGHGLAAAGPAVADREPITLHEVELGVDLPVYPDGPVVLTLPVTVSAELVEAIIGYAACSRTQCLQPVTDKVVTLHPSAVENGRRDPTS